MWGVVIKAVTPWNYDWMPLEQGYRIWAEPLR